MYQTFGNYHQGIPVVLQFCRKIETPALKRTLAPQFVMFFKDHHSACPVRCLTPESQEREPSSWLAPTSLLDMEARLAAVLLPPVTLEEASHTVSYNRRVTGDIATVVIITSSTM